MTKRQTPRFRCSRFKGKHVSEYQYYEFQALDRPLTDEEMRELRGCSTRARITPTSFVNEYAWGSFKGDEDTWMDKYFDAFIYQANWGTHVLKLRLSSRLLSARTAIRYCSGESLSVRTCRGHVILSFVSDDEAEGEWVEGEGHLSSLIAIRAELARGDLRALYLGWLAAAQSGEFDEEALEPPVPPGLSQLNGSLQALADFLRLDTDLLAAAAQASPGIVESKLTATRARAWVAKLPDSEKNALLARVLLGEQANLSAELRRRVDIKRQPASLRTPRNIAELLSEGERLATNRRQLAATKAAKERARREREAATARDRHLSELAGTEAWLWKRVDALIATKQAKQYDIALQVLKDLRDLGYRDDGGTEFTRRLSALRAAHARKPTLVARLESAGM